MARREQLESVQHEYKPVTRHFIDVQVPPEPSADEEAYVIRTSRVDLLILSPRDFQQYVACLRQAASDAGIVA